MARKITVELKKIAFTKMRKLEVYNFYTEIVSVISRFNTKAMHIESTCEVLKGLQEKSKLLVPTEEAKDRHRLTLILDRLHEKRLNFAAILTNQIRTAERANLKGTDDLIILAKPTIIRYLNYLRDKDRVGVEVYINEFFLELEENTDIKNALLELGFKRYLDELELTNNDFKKIYSKRGGQLSRRQKGSTLPIQRELQNIISIVFNQVNNYQHIYTDVDYNDILNAFNHTIATYTKSIKTRDTHRKNKKLKAIEKEQSALEEKPETEEIGNKYHSSIITNKPTPNSLTYKNRNIIEETSDSIKNEEEKDQPINGTMHILKKPDKNKKEATDGEK